MDQYQTCNSAITAEYRRIAGPKPFSYMIHHATEFGANVIVHARYDTTEKMSGATEALAYGTGVIVELLSGTNIYDE